MRILRVFIKPDGHNWLDVPIGDSPTGVVFGVWQREGALIGNDVIIPWDACLFAATFAVPEETVTTQPAWHNLARPGSVVNFPEKPVS